MTWIGAFFLLIFGASELCAQRIDSLPTAVNCAINDLELADPQTVAIVGQVNTSSPRFVIISSDGGIHWDTVAGPYAQPFSVAFPRQDHLFVGGGGVYESRDLGQSWKTSLTGSVNSVTFPDLSHGFTVSSKSTDSGSTWSPIAFTPQRSDFWITNFSMNFQDSVFGTKAITGFYNEDPSLTRFNDVWGTYDGGATWHAIYESTQSQEIPYLGLHVKDSCWLLTFLGGNIMSTTNGGREWNENLWASGQELVKDSKGVIYTSSGMRSLNDGLDFQEWAILPSGIKKQNCIRILTLL